MGTHRRTALVNGHATFLRLGYLAVIALTTCARPSWGIGGLACLSADNHVYFILKGTVAATGTQVTSVVLSTGPAFACAEAPSGNNVMTAFSAGLQGVGASATLLPNRMRTDIITGIANSGVSCANFNPAANGGSGELDLPDATCVAVSGACPANGGSARALTDIHTGGGGIPAGVDLTSQARTISPGPISCAGDTTVFPNGQGGGCSGNVQSDPTAGEVSCQNITFDDHLGSVIGNITGGTGVCADDCSVAPTQSAPDGFLLNGNCTADATCQMIVFTGSNDGVPGFCIAAAGFKIDPSSVVFGTDSFTGCPDFNDTPTPTRIATPTSTATPFPTSTPTATPTAGSCCSAQRWMGCNDTTCQECVCALDSFCCTAIWDGSCVVEAEQQCYTSCACAPTHTPTSTATPTATPPSDCNNSSTTQVTFLDKGAVVPNFLSTTVIINSESIEYLRSQSGDIIEQWSQQIQPVDFTSVQEIIADYGLVCTDDITGYGGCVGWRGMAITIDRTDRSHTFDIMGSVCIGQWPEGVRALVDLESELVTKYRPGALTPTATPTRSVTATQTPVIPASCVGDCGSDGQVTVDELLTMVNIALGNADVASCVAGDANDDGQITVEEILRAVNNALAGCVVPGCGNGVVEPELNEECDDGGTCIGGSNAGTHCTAEDQCQGNGVCIGGSKAETACDPTNPYACPGGSCQKCIAQGGDGCAANCTTETTVEMPLEPGVILDPTKLKAGTSGSTVWNAVLGPLALQMVGGQTLVVGKVGKDNQIPVIINASSIHEIDVAQLSCACVRGVADKTCGGVLFEADGTTLATDCTPAYIMGTCSDTTQKPCTTANETTVCDSQKCVGGICADCHTDDDCADKCVMHACDGKNPCTFVHGQGGTCSVTTTKTCLQDSNCPGGETCVPGGNSGSGVISCVPGLKGTNMLMREDCRPANGQEDPPQCDFTNADTYVQGSTFPGCEQPPVITLSDQNPAPAGAALVMNSTAIGQFAGPCLDNPNRPANFCTDLEDYSTRGLPFTLPLVTGTACGEICNIFMGETTDLCLCNCSDGSWACPQSLCTGPICVQGAPLPSDSNVCSSVAAPSVSGLGLAGAFTSCANPTTIGEIVVTNLLQAR